MNIYKGCCHGCIYCDSRSECYRIQDFDVVRAKANALEIIEQDLLKKRKKGIVITGAMSDPYNPYEAIYELTRGALKLISRYGFGICIDTKSDMVVRDIDLLIKINRYSPVIVNFTITTADDNLCKKIEQNVCLTSERIEAIKKLTAEGIKCGILLMPVLPFINDTKDNIQSIVQMGYEAGVSWIYAGDGFGVTLRQNQREYYYEKLDELFPGTKLIYINRYGDSYICGVPDYSLFEFFLSECAYYNIANNMDDIIREILPPVMEQISFF